MTGVSPCALVEQLGYEGLAKISRPAGQQHLHRLFPDLQLFPTQSAGKPTTVYMATMSASGTGLRPRSLPTKPRIVTESYSGNAMDLVKKET
jgi:hypothetical protein